MSYSFSVKGESKGAVEQAAFAELDRVVQAQPVHVRDRSEALGAVKSLLAVMREPTATEVIQASVSGSIWQKDGEPAAESVSLNVSISFTAKT